MSESSVSHLQRPLSTNIEPGLWRPVIENTKEDRIQKLPFEIVACSGWDDDYPPEELLIQNHTPLAKGWQSQRFCSYPQRLVVRFVAGNCRVRKLQILSHHFKVPTKLEFYIGTALNVGNATANEESDYELKLPKSKLETMSGQTGKQIVFTELGFVTLGDNASTNYRARELKTIHLDAKGSVLQILVHRCYINPLNLYNQVGIIGLNMLGEILDTNYIISGYEEGTYPLLGLDPLKQSLQTKHSGQSPEATIPRNNTNAAYWGQLMSTDVDAKIATTKDLAFDIYHDEQIATLIDAVLEAKKIAVAEEKFPLAKCLASLFDLCVKAGKEIAQMMVSKHRAIEAEQYDSAEQTKKDIEWMRFSLLAKIEELGLRLTKDERIVPAKGEYPTAKSQTTISTKTDKKQVRELKQHNKPNTTVSVSTEEHPRRTKNNNAPIPPQDHGKADASVSTSFSDIFKEPARDLKPAGLDDPERLSADEEALWAVPIDVHGIFLIRCLLTPKFKLREFALSEVSKRLDLWDRRQHERRKLLKNKRREKAVGQETRELRRTNRHANSDNEEVRSARRRRRSSSVVSFRSDDGNTNRTWSSRVSSDDSDSQVTEAVRTPSRKVDNSSSKLNPLLKQLDDSDGKESIWTREQLLEQEQIRTRWYGEVQAKQVSVETFLRATLQIIGKGLDDPREKTALLSLTLWEQLTRVCSKHKISPQIVYKAFDDVVPLLLLRSSDLNSRVRQACMDLAITLAYAYHKQPYSFFNFLLKPITYNSTPAAITAKYHVRALSNKTASTSEPKSISGIPPRLIQARLQLLSQMIKRFEFDYVDGFVDDGRNLEGRRKSDRNSKEQTGLTIESAMRFTEDFLQHQNKDVRDAAIGVVVEIVLVAGEEAMSGHLLNLRPIQLQTVHDSIMKAKGLPIKLRQKERPIQPWKEPVLLYTRPSRPTTSQSHNSSQQRQRSRQRSQPPNSSSKTQAVSSSVRRRTSSGVSGSTPAKKSLETALENPLAELSLEEHTIDDEIGDLQSDVVALKELIFDESRGTQMGRRAPSKSPKAEASRQGSTKTWKTKGDSVGDVAMNFSSSIKKRSTGSHTRQQKDPAGTSFSHSHERTCIFCDEYNSLFNENHLEEHYWRDCPMLAHCPLCYQVIEIPNLTFHMVNECENRSVVSACPRCHEAVLASEFRSHVSRRSCRPYPVDPNASRCPICHLDVPGGEKGWRLHLLAGDGCPQSDRKPRVAFGDHEIETD